VHDGRVEARGHQWRAHKSARQQLHGAAQCGPKLAHLHQRRGMHPRGVCARAASSTRPPVATTSTTPARVRVSVGGGWVGGPATCCLILRRIHSLTWKATSPTRKVRLLFPRVPCLECECHLLRPGDGRSSPVPVPLTHPPTTAAFSTREHSATRRLLYIRVDKERRQLLCNSSTIYGVDKERRQLLAGAWCVRAARYCCCRHGSFAWVGGWVGGCAEWWVLLEGVPLPPWHGTLLQVDVRALE
jgi:hypothetical protein